MKFTTIQKIEWVTCIIMPVILAVTIFFNIWYLPIIFFLAAAVIFGIVLSRVKEVYKDEMTHAILEKGGKACLNIGCVTMIITGVILLAVSDSVTSATGIAAITLFAAAFGLNVINTFTKLYYQAKLGGSNRK